MKKKLLIPLCLVLIGAAGGGWYLWHSAQKPVQKTVSKPLAQKPLNNQPFTLDLQSSHTLAVNKPQAFKLTIHDQNNKVFNAFDTSNDEVLRLFIIRKDRTNFQLVHAGYDPRTGIFTASNLVLPTDGPYRLFAQFTPKNAKLNTAGNKIAETPYVDITAGNPKNYTPIPPLAAKVITSADGYDTNIFFAPPDDSPGAAVSYYNANSLNTVAVEINKNGAPFTNLEDYRGSIARIAAFGPNLEFSAVNSEPVGGAQTGLAIFELPFTKPGLYILFMQTQVNDQVSTFDYNVTVKDTGAISPNGGTNP